MSRPAWVDVPDSDLELDDPGKTSVVKQIRDNAAAGRICVFSAELAENDTVTIGGGAGVWVEHPSAFFSIDIPDVADYTGIQRLLSVTIQGKTVGGATGTYRLKDSATSNTGTEPTTTSATYVDLTLTLDIDASWKGTKRTIVLELKSSSGSNTAYAKKDAGADNYLEF